ncbi:glucose dehydrogenase [Alphaproteobacteria bacterium 46_93_T64]|nr:glucose dehydrogenase [Alphaproteobacteria bacterium 46_93_T64]
MNKYLQKTIRLNLFWQFAAASIILIVALPSSASEIGFNKNRPNAERQQPDFQGQTRAPVIQDTLQIEKTTFAKDLKHPWGMVQLPNGSWLVTERPGRLRLVSSHGEISKPIIGLPVVDARGQGGLLDVTVQKDFSKTRRIWWSYAEPREGGKNGTSVATGKLSSDGASLSDVKVIFRQTPAWDSTYHFGSRLVFDRTGALFITTGERSYGEASKLSQDITTHLGKILRINPEGGAAAGNPNIKSGLPEIWSWGHRNVQAATLGLNGALWTVEHGPRGGDELNRPEAGLNYGWPVITYGENYDGSPVNNGITKKSGMEQPLYYWDPVIAPSGMTFYNGNQFPHWRGSILIGGLASRSLVRLVMDKNRVIGEARYLQGQARIRDVKNTHDGAIMILTDSNSGTMTKLAPKQ